MQPLHTSGELKREFALITLVWMIVSLILALLFVHVARAAHANPPLLTPWPLLSALALVFCVMARPFYVTWYQKWHNQHVLEELHKQLHEHYGGNVPSYVLLQPGEPLDGTIAEAIEAKRRFFAQHYPHSFVNRDINTTLELTRNISRELR